MLTEKEAATAYAKAWNTLDCTEFLELLDEDTVYTSMWVLEDLKGKFNIAPYLSKKMEAVKEEGSDIKAELGKATTFDPGRDCVVVTQDGEVIVTVVFKVKEGKIIRYDMTTPESDWPDRSGVFPT